MKKLFLLATIAIVLTTQSIYAQTYLKFVNNSNQNISACYAKYLYPTDVWQSCGWWIIPAGGTKQINIGSNFNGSTIYVYGLGSKGGVWGVGKKFAVGSISSAFTIDNADGNTEEGTLKPFFEFKGIVKGKVNTWTFRP